MRAVGYYRTEGEDGPESLQGRESAFASYCERNAHQSVTSFAERGPIVGRGGETYGRMIEFMRGSGSQFLLVVPDATHLGSDLEAVARVMLELEGMGARVTCIDESFPDPLQNAFHTLGVKGVSRTRSQRIRESMRARAVQGQALGKPLFGYRIGDAGTLEVVPAESAVVELIFRLYTRDGIGMRLIAQHLNERAISTRRGGRWNVVSIRDLLKNSVYMGTYARFGFRLPRFHQAIVPPDVFRAAQDQTRKRRPVGRVRDPQPFVLSGLVFCGYCGNKMIGSTRRQTWKRSDGRRSRGVYRYYQCQSRANQGVCGYHTWRASRLEANVLSQLKQAFKAGSQSGGDDGRVAAERRQRVQEMNEERLRNGERKLVKAIRRAARGEVRVAVLAGYLAQVDSARKALSAPAALVDPVAMLDTWESADIGARRSFLEGHVQRIVVRDDLVDLSV